MTELMECYNNAVSCHVPVEVLRNLIIAPINYVVIWAVMWLRHYHLVKIRRQADRAVTSLVFGNIIIVPPVFWLYLYDSRFSDRWPWTNTSCSETPKYGIPERFVLKKLIKTQKKPLQKQRKARFCGLYKHELKVHGKKQTDTIIRIAKCRMPLRKIQALPHNDECSHQIKKYTHSLLEIITNICYTVENITKGVAWKWTGQRLLLCCVQMIVDKRSGDALRCSSL